MKAKISLVCSILLCFICCLAVLFSSCKIDSSNKTTKTTSNHYTTKDSVILKNRIDRIKRYKSRRDSINQSLGWQELPCGLWQSNKGSLGIKTQEATEQGIDIDRFITHLCCEGKTIKSVVDTATFEYLGSSFYKDKNHVYTHYIMADGGNFWIVREADVATFEVLGDCYGKDKNHIFSERNMVLDSVDYKSFKTKKGIGCLAKDKFGYYFWDTKIDTSDWDDPYVKEKILELDKL